MKIIFALLFVLIYSKSNSQVGAGGNQNSDLVNCEDLVFNTRELTQFAFNTRCKTEAYPFISEDGFHMYFTNNQTYNWLFYSHKDSSTGIWTVPVPLVIANFKTPIRSCYLDKTFNFLFFTCESGGSGSASLYRCQSIQGSMTDFSKPEIIDIISTVSSDNTQPFSNLSFSEDLSQMMAHTAHSDNNSMASFIKTGDNTYTYVKHISTTPAEMGILNRDGLIYYFTNKLYKNVLFCRKRNSLNEDFGSQIYKVKVFESNLRVTQVRISEPSKTIVLVLSDDLWEMNDIYFYNYNDTDSFLTHTLFDESAYIRATEKINNSIPAMVEEKNAPQPLKKVEILNQAGADICRIEIGNPFPNPAKNQFYVYYHVSGENGLANPPILVLLDNSGRIVYSQKLEHMQGEVLIMPDHVGSGVYYMRIDYNGLTSLAIRITLTL